MAKEIKFIDTTLTQDIILIVKMAILGISITTIVITFTCCIVLDLNLFDGFAFINSILWGK